MPQKIKAYNSSTETGPQTEPVPLDLLISEIHLVLERRVAAYCSFENNSFPSCADTYGLIPNERPLLLESCRQAGYVNASGSLLLVLTGSLANAYEASYMY